MRVGIWGLCVLACLARPAAADDRIRILAPTWTGFAGVFVADDLGFFKAQGISVDMKFEDERPNVMAAMARGDIEVDMRSIGEYQGRPRDDATPGVIIATTDQSVGADGVVAAGDIHSVADLKGKNVASEPNIPARLLLQLALKKVGLSFADLHIKEIVTADSVAVFGDTSISAAVSFEPFMSQILKADTDRNPHILISSREVPGLIVDSVIVRNDDLKQNPGKYRKFLIGLLKATAYYEKDPDGFVKLAAPHFNLSPADFKSSIETGVHFQDLADNRRILGKPGAPGTIFPAFDQVMALNLENGAADHHLTAAHSIDNSIVATITEADLK